DLKSFYASVECVERGLNPLTTNLVVADVSRTEKTICLAVTPSLKECGISGRARLFEVVSQVKKFNAERRRALGKGAFEGKSYLKEELEKNPKLELDYIAAKPRMALYMEYSTRIYSIYLEYVAPEDMHIYSVDEVFIDLTPYLRTYDLTPEELTMKMIRHIFRETGITATAGIGSNLYLAKVAMDIVAKHMDPDENGVRMARLDERSYREILWSHKPITDFWRVGRGYAKKLASKGMYTMGDVARCSLGGQGDFYNEDLLFSLFGVNAELLIDHAWGYEPVTLEEIKSYKPENNSISSGQVLSCPYDFSKGRLVVQEMTDLLVLDLVDKGLMTDQVVLTVGYDIGNKLGGEDGYKGEVSVDHYGRKVPKHAHGTVNFPGKTSSTREIMEGVLDLYDRIVNEKLLIRRFTIAANHVTRETLESASHFKQLELFVDYEEQEREREKEKRLQKAMLDVKKKYGKNAILKGMNLQEGGTAMDRNRQIGGHKA
nr:DNA methylase [Eubacterium sp.]